MIQIVNPAVLCLGLFPTGRQFAVVGMLVGHVVRASPAVQNGLSGETLLLRLLLGLLLLDRGRSPISTAPARHVTGLRLIAIYIATVVGRLLLLVGSVYAGNQTGRDFAQRGRTAVGTTVMDGEAIGASADPTQYGGTGPERRVG